MINTQAYSGTDGEMIPLVPAGQVSSSGMQNENTGAATKRILFAFRRYNAQHTGSSQLSSVSTPSSKAQFRQLQRYSSFPEASLYNTPLALRGDILEAPGALRYSIECFVRNNLQTTLRGLVVPNDSLLRTCWRIPDGSPALVTHETSDT